MQQIHFLQHLYLRIIAENVSFQCCVPILKAQSFISKNKNTYPILQAVLRVLQLESFLYVAFLIFYDHLKVNFHCLVVYLYHSTTIKQGSKNVTNQIFNITFRSSTHNISN